MANTDKKELIEKQSKQVLLFNRFLWLRYSLALLFFINFYWFIFLIGMKSYGAILPLILLFLNIPSLAEQIKLYSHHKNNLTYARYFFVFQVIILGILGIIINLEIFFNLFFPFLIFNSLSLGLIYIVMFIILGISLLNLHALKSIRHNTDTFYQKLSKEYN
ncbi:hypothetical protein [Aerococcus kribbianus]|uniref:PTS cellobiose transporter subunit IIC n=1 Tax=Aerococcus kribbianus TaxID=2999064 RepID=A0A9X3FNK9_9LACT|nr:MULTISPECIES: hypothetical protein [unclassified Aerococcus]MCZ0717594.1 hypothetical protein [Aerococcus sp. YH-aer221]MCZ0725882.1 hypothetical protein [Aerococcus sp. YH-aer222]